MQLSNGELKYGKEMGGREWKCDKALQRNVHGVQIVCVCVCIHGSKEICRILRIANLAIEKKERERERQL